MKLPFRGLSSIQKFFIILSIIFLAAAVDYRLFVNKARKIELYDGLNSRISTIRVSITQLEYMLDIFAIASRFENTTNELIQNDVVKLDEHINAVLDNPGYNELLMDDERVSDLFTAIVDDWQIIKTEIRRLNDAMSQNEVMLIHNAVDMNTVLTTEKTERLLGLMSENRSRAFGETKSLALKSIVVFILSCLVAAFGYYKRVQSPARKAAAAARRIASGELKVRFASRRGSAIEELSEELNAMLDAIGELSAREKKKIDGLEDNRKRLLLQIEALNTILSSAGRSLSQSEVYSAAVKEAAPACEADGAALFIIEGESLILKASAGFDDKAKEGLSVPARDIGALDNVRIIKDIADCPQGDLRDVLRSSGFSSAVSVPVVYDKKVMGALWALYHERPGYPARATAFFGAVASAVAVSAGHSGLFQSEHTSKRFFERILNQMPFGLAVFDTSGRCLVMNSSLQRLLGADARLASDYVVFEDDVLSSSGMITSIKKSYEGYSTEFIINYNPHLLKRPRLNGEQKRLKIKSIPLYDSGGEISNIALIYEDLTGAAVAGPGTGDTVK